MTFPCPDCGGEKKSEESPRCRSCSNRRRKFTPETKEKIRQAALRRERKPYKTTGIKEGHAWAIRWIELPSLCERCGDVPPVDRHHVDGDSSNNDRSNIMCLCRRCHQIVDGRHLRLKHEIPSMGGKAGKYSKTRK